MELSEQTERSHATETSSLRAEYDKLQQHISLHADALGVATTFVNDFAPALTQRVEDQRQTVCAMQTHVESLTKELSDVRAHALHQENLKNQLARVVCDEAIIKSVSTKPRDIDRWATTSFDLLGAIGLDDTQRAAVVDRMQSQVFDSALGVADQSSAYYARKVASVLTNEFPNVQARSTALQSYFASLSGDTVEAIIGEHLPRLRQEAMQDWVDEYQDYLSTPRILRWVQDNTVSRPVYLEMRDVVRSRAHAA